MRGGCKRGGIVSLHANAHGSHSSSWVVTALTNCSDGSSLWVPLWKRRALTGPERRNHLSDSTETKNLVSPKPLNLRGEDAPPKFRGRSSKKHLKKGSWTLRPLNLGALRPLNLGGASSPLEFRGFGLTGFFLSLLSQINDFFFLGL